MEKFDSFRLGVEIEKKEEQKIQLQCTADQEAVQSNAIPVYINGPCANSTSVGTGPQQQHSVWQPYYDWQIAGGAPRDFGLQSFHSSWIAPATKPDFTGKNSDILERCWNQFYGPGYDPEVHGKHWDLYAPHNLVNRHDE